MLLFTDSFDHYQAALLKWDVLAPHRQPVGIRSIVSRTGLQSLVFRSQSQVQNNQFGYVAKNFPNTATFIVGFAYFANLGNHVGIADWGLVSFLDGSTLQVDLRMTTSGTVYFTRNGTILGSPASINFTFNAWHYIEVLVTINNTTGVVTLKCDGVQYINLTGQNTRSSANNFANQIWIGQTLSTGTGNVTLALSAHDDLYVCDNTGSFNNTFLGDTAVKMVAPTGNGSSLQYTKVEPAWVASTLFWIGRRIKDSNGNIQEVTACTSDCKTGSLVPTWNVTTGGTTTDNHVIWTNRGAATDFLEINQTNFMGLGDWDLSVSYGVGVAIVDINGNIQVCTTAGTTTSDFSNITWNVTPGGTTNDGTVVWTNQGTVGSFQDCYLVDATVGDISRFTYPAISANSVSAVSVTMRVAKDDSATRSVRGSTLSGVTVGASPSDLALSTSYQVEQGIFETDPNTSAAWTQTAVNAAQFGIKTTA